MIGAERGVIDLCTWSPEMAWNKTWDASIAAECSGETSDDLTKLLSHGERRGSLVACRPEWLFVHLWPSVLSLSHTRESSQEKFQKFNLVNRLGAPIGRHHDCAVVHLLVHSFCPLSSESSFLSPCPPLQPQSLFCSPIATWRKACMTVPSASILVCSLQLCAQSTKEAHRDITGTTYSCVATYEGAGVDISLSHSSYKIPFSTHLSQSQMNRVASPPRPSSPSPTKSA